VLPLALEADEKRVAGIVAFRLTDAFGVAPGEGEPVVEGNPGEVISMHVQMRTEVPLNGFCLRLRWPGQKLLCEGGIWSIFVNPENGDIYTPLERSTTCGDGFLGTSGGLSGDFSMGGGWLGQCGDSLYRDRPLEYFKPLGEWVDVFELSLSIPDGAAGGSEIPLHFLARDPAHRTPDDPIASYYPYHILYPCETGHPSDNRPDNWSYSVDYAPGFVRVLGDQEPVPPDPPDAGVRISVGDASGRPGELVEVPIYASAEALISVLRLALEVDPGAAVVEGLDVRLFSVFQGIHIRRVLARGETFELRECEDPESCVTGVPWLTLFHETDERFVLADFLMLHVEGAPLFPGASLAEVAKLRLRIRDDFAGAETVVRPAKVTWTQGAFEEVTESGGFLIDNQVDLAPANETQAGTITVLGRGFLRGDTNGDGNVDLSDAVATLNFLFLGSDDPACKDAADANDSGVIDITDAIFQLGVLFLGQGDFPAPHPECGEDPTKDTLGCRRGCDAE
jgi:hypothetical protein